MQEILELAKRLEGKGTWNPLLMEDMVTVKTPFGVKSLSLADALGLESSIENVLRLHLVHSLKKKL
jgi:hypothetical protein